MSAEEARERLGLDADAKSRAVVVPDDAQLSVDLQGYQELQMVGAWGLQMVTGGSRGKEGSRRKEAGSAGVCLLHVPGT